MGITLALLVTRGTFNVMSMTGIIMLMGLISSTRPTLIAVPVAYTFLDDAAGCMARRRAAAPAGCREPAPVLADAEVRAPA